MGPSHGITAALILSTHGTSGTRIPDPTCRRRPSGADLPTPSLRMGEDCRHDEGGSHGRKSAAHDGHRGDHRRLGRHRQRLRPSSPREWLDRRRCQPPHLGRRPLAAGRRGRRRRCIGGRGNGPDRRRARGHRRRGDLRRLGARRTGRDDAARRGGSSDRDQLLRHRPHRRRRPPLAQGAPGPGRRAELDRRPHRPAVPGVLLRLEVRPRGMGRGPGVGGQALWCRRDPRRARQLRHRLHGQPSLGRLNRGRPLPGGAGQGHQHHGGRRARRSRPRAGGRGRLAAARCPTAPSAPHRGSHRRAPRLLRQATAAQSGLRGCLGLEPRSVSVGQAGWRAG